MNLTKRQKGLSVVFLVGLVAVAADRTILRPQGGPQAASAGSGASSAGPAISSVVLAREVPQTGAAARATLTKRLNNLLASPGIGAGVSRDPFSLPASWSDTGQTEEEKRPDAVQEFTQRHQLKAVVVQGRQTWALVGDSFLVPGQSLEGFTLISVGYRSAVFEREGRQAVLPLVDKEGPSMPRSPNPGASR